ncbi:MAG: hypothetical protein ABIH83_02615 [Candidatus Micrarchaeota archaeon]
MKRIFTIFILIFGLIISGCINPPTPPKDKPATPSQPAISPPTTLTNDTPPVSENQTTDPCLQYNNVLESDECYKNLAHATDNFSLCNKIYSVATRDVCLLPFSRLDAKLCNNLVSSKNKQDCFESAALRLNNTDYCTKISDGERKQECLKKLSPPCSFEPDAKSTRLCQALYYNDTSYCRAGACFFELGVENSNLDACNEISSSERALSLACKSIVNDNITICNDTGIDTVSDYCLKLAAERADKPVWCTFTSEGSPYGNMCLEYFAVKNNDPTLCKYTAPEMERDNCYINYSTSTGNYSACEKAINSLLRSECYFDTAIENGDVGACNQMGYKSRPSCYNLVISGEVPIKSLESCDSIIEESWKAKCYVEYAWQTENSSVCDLIEEEKYIDDCKFRVG